MATTPILPETTKSKTQNRQNGTRNGYQAIQSPSVQELCAPDDGRYVSKEVYWADYYHLGGHEFGDVSYEWNNGYLEAKPLTTKAQLTLYRWFCALIEQYIKTYQNAESISLEVGFSMLVPNPEIPGTMKEAVRKPDLGIVRHDNQVQWGDDERSYHGTFDLCIESLSDSTARDVRRDTEDKRHEYEAAGVQEYYILDPDGTHMHFYECTPQGIYAEIQPNPDGVIHSQVLPNFRFRVRDLYHRPELEDLIQDEVYSGYVLREYQAMQARVEQEHLRAEQEHLRAEQEHLRAEQERQYTEQERQRAEQAESRAERYAAKLRELGIDIGGDDS